MAKIWRNLVVKHNDKTLVKHSVKLIDKFNGKTLAKPSVRHKINTKKI
jgi:hypothetical protein